MNRKTIAQDGKKAEISFIIRLLPFFAKKHRTPLSLPAGFTVTCHAGAMDTEPNTLTSVEKALKWGAQIVEFDVTFRPDGTPVMIHKEKPEQNEGIELEPALKLVSENESCKINLDLKSTANLPSVDKLVEKYSLSDRVFFTGVFASWVPAVKENSNISYYCNHNITPVEAKSRKDAQKVADMVKNLGAIGVNANYLTASKLFVDVMHENGLLVSLWTLNNLTAMRKALAMQPDNITTKNPNTLMWCIENEKNS